MSNVCNIEKYDHHNQSVLPEGRAFAANAGTKVAVLSKGRSSSGNSGNKILVLLSVIIIYYCCSYSC